MPFATVRLTPGVKTEVTPSLNQAGISSSNNIRFVDGLPQKIGGWTNFYPFSVSGVPRELHAWADLNAVNHLAVATTSNLFVITNGLIQDLTPQSTTTNDAVSFSTVSGSNVVTITDSSTNTTTYDVVVINTPVSVGGLVISGAFGAYPVAASEGPNQYEIIASSNATATVTNGGAVPTFTTTSSSQSVTVTLANHGLAAGGSFSIMVPVTVGGLTLSGLYTVASVVSSSQFTINAQYQATSAATVSMNSGNAQIVYWITPVQSAPGTGYGVYTYGGGGYGTGIVPPPHVGTEITATDYCLDNWGQDLLSNPKGGPIFDWGPYSGLRGSQMIAQAPIACNGMFVAMPQQQIVAYGAAVLGIIDPLLVAWCDVGNRAQWTASTTNQAGTFRLPRGSQIVGGLQTPQQGLLWTDLAVWSMQYIGYPLVYSFNEIGTGCGLIAQKAACALGSSAYWMSQKGFYAYVGGAVQPLPCDVWDVIFQNLNTSNLDKIRCGANSQFNEIIWFFPSLSGLENDTYVKFNTVSNVWDYGSMNRSAWINQSVLGPPIAAGVPSTNSDYSSDFSLDFTGSYSIVQHETTNDAAGSAIDSWFETGYFMLSEGEEKVFIDYMIPDFKYGLYGQSQAASIKITVYVTDFPEAAPRVYGPFTVTSASKGVNLRARGRYAAFKVESSDLGSFWRLGGVKFRLAPDGRN